MKHDEKSFFDDVYKDNVRKPVLKYYEIAKRSRKLYEEHLFSFSRNKKVLEYGCGTGSYAIALSRMAESVYGVDISEVGIESARNKAEKERLDNASFLVMDAEELQFTDNSFDVVCGTGILHHLNLDKALKEIKRVLKPGGKALFIEPMGYNPVINLYRKLTPRYRTKDEHPLMLRDLRLIRNSFGHASFLFCHLLSLLAVPIRKRKIFSSVLSLLDRLDDYLLKYRLFGILAWQVLIILEQPEKRSEGSEKTFLKCKI